MQSSYPFYVQLDVRLWNNPVQEYSLLVCMVVPEVTSQKDSRVLV